MTKRETNIIETFNVPNPSDDLADRIIMQSRKTPQKMTMAQRLSSLLPNFNAPVFSYGFASIFVAALLIGGTIYTNIPPSTSITDDYAVDYTMDDLFNESDSLLIL